MKLLNPRPAPEKFPADIDYITHIKDFGDIDVNVNYLNSLRTPSENLYLIHLEDESLIKNDLKEYFHFLNHFLHTENYEKFNNNIFGFTKNLWLIRDFIKNKKFDNPCCAHWNPRIKKIVIHPGGQRIKVLKLFNKVHEHKFFFWNTNGVWFDWMDSDGVIEIDSFPDIFKDYNFGFILDHGSVIPQVVFNDRYNHMDWVEEYYYSDVLPMIKSLKIYYEFDCKFLKKHKTNNFEKATTHIEIKNDTEISLYKCSFIPFLGIDYEDEDVVIKHLKKPWSYL